MEEMTNSTPSYPFISSIPTVEYVRTSKLLVLVNENQNLLLEISRTYGNDSLCVSATDESERLKEARSACETGQHMVAIETSFDNKSQLQFYADLAHDHNYIISLAEEPMGVLPVYVGWHLNEADSCMLGLVTHTHLEELLRTFPEFCSDFRNFSQSETIPEMLNFYKLASSNYHGMLHCTAKYLGYSPTQESSNYFRNVKSRLSQFYGTSVIGLVFTPRTFGARVKLTVDQLELWDGDDDNAQMNSDSHENNRSPRKDLDSSPFEKVHDPVHTMCSAFAAQSISEESHKALCGRVNSSLGLSEPAESARDSPRRFPHCQASLVCVPGKDEPDFHPVTGLGRRAHMTLGVAPGVSAVTTGTDLLQVVQCEADQLDWPTYEGPRGWLRDYGEGRWVLYLKKEIHVGALFSGIYDFTSNKNI